MDKLSSILTFNSTKIENSKELALKTAVEIAKNAYQEGLSISSIARMTGLSEEEISKHI